MKNLFTLAIITTTLCTLSATTLFVDNKTDESTYAYETQDEDGNTEYSVEEYSEQDTIDEMICDVCAEIINTANELENSGCEDTVKLEEAKRLVSDTSLNVYEQIENINKAASILNSIEEIESGAFTEYYNDLITETFGYIGVNN